MSHWQQIMVLVRITIRIQEFLTDFFTIARLDQLQDFSVKLHK